MFRISLILWVFPTLCLSFIHVFPSRSYLNHYLSTTASPEVHREAGRFFKKGYGAKITRELDTIFDFKSSKHDIIDKLRKFAEIHDVGFNHIHAVAIIHRCGRLDIDVTDIFPIPKLFQYFNGKNHRDYWLSFEIGQAMYGMKSMAPTNPNIKDYLHFIIQKLKACNTNFSDRDIGYCLYGLQEFACSVPEVITIIRILIKKLERNHYEFTGAALSNCFYGLRKMCNQKDVLKLLALLSDKLEQTQSGMSTKSIAFALNGLQSMSDQDKVVLKVVKLLTMKLASATDTLLQRSVGAAMMGLRSMTADSVEVQDLLHQLTMMIRESKERITDFSACSAINGLRCMSDNSSHVQDIISAIVAKLDVIPSHITFSPRTISNALYGMKNMTGDNNAAKALIRAFMYRIDDYHPFSSADISRAFYGLQSMSSSSCPEVLPVISTLTSYINQLPHPMPLQDLSVTLYGFRAQCVVTKEIAEAFKAIAKQFEANTMPMEHEQKSMSMSGLQGFDSSSPEIRLLIYHIIPHFKSFDARGCGNCLQGIHRMTSDSIEVISLLQRFAECINTCNEQPSSQEFSCAFYGLQNKDSRVPAVINVLKALNDKLAPVNSHIQMTAHELSMALTGLQTMSSEDSPEVLRTMGLLAAQVESNREIFTPQQIAHCLFGMQGMVTDSTEVRYLLDSLCRKMEDQGFEQVYSARDIGYCLCGLSGLRPLLIPEVMLLCDELNIKVAASEFKGQPELLFLQFGRAVRVKTGSRIIPTMSSSVINE